MADDKELAETVRAAFACYDEDSSGWIDAAELRHLVADLGGVLTERDFRKALRILDRDDNGVIDQDEFTEWWVGQARGDEASGEVEKTLARLKELGRQRFKVDLHTACWGGFEDVVARLVDSGSELINQKDSSEYGNLNTPLHYAAYQGHASICDVLIKRGASINSVNGSGCTPMFFAAQQGRVEVVKLLLQSDAELRVAESKHGLTPVDVCTTPAITELFRNLSGKPPSIPAAPTLETVSDTELKILWSPPRPNLDEVVPVSGYKIKLTSSSSPMKIMLAVAFPTETSISGLSADTEYVAAICAINLHGMSEFSTDSDPAKTRKAKPSAPVLCVTETRPTDLTLMWALADSDRQPGVTCVIYLSSPEPDGTCKWEPAFKTDDRSITTTTLEKLLPDHRYKLRAAVINDDGQQTLSDAIATRTASKAVAKRGAPGKLFGAVNALRSFAANKSGAKESKEVGTVLSSTSAAENVTSESAMQWK
ncbi:fact complex subunit [Phytophthora cinnamomi]|uniref:fact complex subunit n=1 Tax=Phytophthora cinnamomi TaxID=4785 RepID=UPI0035595187|nr:fact complex subunit [Phytophthora cinnamomi]